MRLIGPGRVVAAVFGDGAVEEGVFSESVNFAALHHLPIVFVCEHNQYAIHSHVRARQATARLVDRVRTYGVDAHRGARNDVLLMLDAMTARGREGASREGPVFLEFGDLSVARTRRARRGLRPWVTEPRRAGTLDC